MRRDSKVSVFDVRLMLGFGLVAASVMCAAFAATPAIAATVERSGTSVVFQGAAGEVSNLQVQTTANTTIDPETGTSGPVVKIDEQSSTIDVTPGGGCRSGFQGFVECSLDGVARIELRMGDGDDVVTWMYDRAHAGSTVPITVEGGPGIDQLGTFVQSTQPPYFYEHPAMIDPGPGVDEVGGSDADDAISAVDGEADSVTCFEGIDTVTADPIDTVAADCENVDNGTAPRPEGPDGISINEGAVFTNDPDVTLTVRWPRLASSVFVANDGGFGDSELFEVAPEISWTLVSSGRERLPKTVYSRFVGGDSGPETYSDDIILDQTDPEVTSATIGSGPSGRVVRASKVGLRIEADDKASGVEGLQVVESKKKAPKTFREFKSTVQVRAVRKLFVRVQDGAGNISRWKRVKAE